MAAPGVPLFRIASCARIISILGSCDELGATPVRLTALHTIAYFSDALAPVWGIPVIDRQILKRRRGPVSPVLQADIDTLVGQAVILASRVSHVQEEGKWRLDARYSLNKSFSQPIFDAMLQSAQFRRELDFVQEVVLALAGLGAEGLSKAPEVDATYADPDVDVGNVIDLDFRGGSLTKTVEVARRFRALIEDQRRLTDAELTHLYVRHLYGQLQSVGVS